MSPNPVSGIDNTKLHHARKLCKVVVHPLQGFLIDICTAQNMNLNHASQTSAQGTLKIFVETDFLFHHVF